MTKINVIKSNEQTSQDIPLSFNLDNSRLDETHLYLYGTVSNPSQVSYYSVTLIITIRDQNGNFIFRDDLPVEPDFIRPGEVAYFGVGGLCIRCTDCSKKEAITVEYKIIGEKRVR